MKQNVKRSSLSEMSRNDHLIEQSEQSKTDSRFSQVEPSALAPCDEEGSRGYRMIALAAMIILAAAALVFWFYLRS